MLLQFLSRITLQILDYFNEKNVFDEQIIKTDKGCYKGCLHAMECNSSDNEYSS